MLIFNPFATQLIKKKNGTDQHDEDQEQTEKGLTIGHCTITVQTRRPSYYD
jgi:hypothetical protein